MSDWQLPIERQAETERLRELVADFARAARAEMGNERLRAERDRWRKKCHAEVEAGIEEFARLRRIEEAARALRPCYQVDSEGGYAWFENPKHELVADLADALAEGGA